MRCEIAPKDLETPVCFTHGCTDFHALGDKTVKDLKHFRGKVITSLFTLENFLGRLSTGLIFGKARLVRNLLKETMQGAHKLHKGLDEIFWEGNGKLNLAVFELGGRDVEHVVNADGVVKQVCVA